MNTSVYVQTIIMESNRRESKHTHESRQRLETVTDKNAPSPSCLAISGTQSINWQFCRRHFAQPELQLPCRKLQTQHLLLPYISVHSNIIVQIQCAPDPCCPQLSPTQSAPEASGSTWFHAVCMRQRRLSVVSRVWFNGHLRSVTWRAQKPYYYCV